MKSNEKSYTCPEGRKSDMTDRHNRTHFPPFCYPVLIHSRFLSGISTPFTVRIFTWLLLSIQSLIFSSQVYGASHGPSFSWYCSNQSETSLSPLIESVSFIPSFSPSVLVTLDLRSFKFVLSSQSKTGLRAVFHHPHSLFACLEPTA